MIARPFGLPRGVKISIASPTPSASPKTTSCCCLYVRGCDGGVGRDLAETAGAGAAFGGASGGAATAIVARPSTPAALATHSDSLGLNRRRCAPLRRQWLKRRGFYPSDPLFMALGYRVARCLGIKRNCTFLAGLTRVVETGNNPPDIDPVRPQRIRRPPVTATP